MSFDSRHFSKILIFSLAAEWESSYSRVRQRSGASSKSLGVPPVGRLALLSFLPQPGGMGGSRWPGEWTGILLPSRHGAHHLGQPLFRHPHGPWAAPRRGTLLPVAPSVSCPVHPPHFQVVIRLGAAGGWNQWSALLLQPDVRGDVLGSPRAAESLPPTDGAYERAQVSQRWTGKDRRPGCSTYLLLF